MTKQARKMIERKTPPQRNLAYRAIYPTSAAECKALTVDMGLDITQLGGCRGC
jgi:hypothetical protein